MITLVLGFFGHQNIHAFNHSAQVPGIKTLKSNSNILHDTQITPFIYSSII